MWVIIGSTASIQAVDAMSIYGGSKAALRAMVRCWIKDIAHSGIRVNMLTLGAIDTWSLRNALEGASELRTRSTTSSSRWARATRWAGSASQAKSAKPSSIPVLRRVKLRQAGPGCSLTAASRRRRADRGPRAGEYPTSLVGGNIG